MDDGLIELFENVKREFHDLSVEDFTATITRIGRDHFNFYSAICDTPLMPVWSEFQQYVNTITNTSLPQKLRENALQKLRLRLDEVLLQLTSGTINLPKRRISEETINRITNLKIKHICMEINNCPDQNVLSLAQNVGEALKWTLWFKAKQVGTSLKETGNLGPLLDEAINKPYFQSNVARRFLGDFKNNFMKTGYDMVRHSDSYIPDIHFLNPQIHALEVILNECF